MTEPKLSNQDKLDIIECVSSVGLLGDAREWDSMALLFEPEFTLDYTSLLGGEPLQMTPETFTLNFARDQLTWFDSTQHQTTNFIVRGSGIEAEVKASVRAVHVKSGYENYIMGGIYTKRLRRSAGSWRICYQKFGLTYEENHEGENSAKTAWFKAISTT